MTKINCQKVAKEIAMQYRSLMTEVLVRNACTCENKVSMRPRRSSLCTFSFTNEEEKFLSFFVYSLRRVLRKGERRSANEVATQRNKSNVKSLMSILSAIERLRFSKEKTIKTYTCLSLKRTHEFKSILSVS